MRAQPISSWSLLKLKRSTAQQGGARRWLVLSLVLTLLLYLGTASWFAVSLFRAGTADGGDGADVSPDGGFQLPQGLGENPDADPADEAKEDDGRPYDPDDVHIVFSTGCNLFQHWQAEVLLHSHYKVGQKGKITRVVSGCDTEAQKRAHAKFLTHPEGLADETVPMEELQKSSHPHFRLHVTPSFPGAREFPWINKPMGLAHWLKHANPPVKEKIIVIIDPDQFFMDRLYIDGKRKVQGEARPYGQGGILCTSGCKGGKIFGKPVQGMDEIVRKGFPVAQTYGLGGSFVHVYNVTAIAGPRSPATQLSYADAEKYYSVGPPMMAHLDDMRNIFSKWVEYMHPVFNQVPGDIQADMYAYSFAAANFHLPHIMYDHYMVSSPKTSGEAWPFVDRLGSMPCSNPNRNAHGPDAYAPTFLHVAQRYDSDTTPFMFHKGHVPPNILDCDLPLIITPPEDLVDNAQGAQKHKNYMLCNAYVLINEAVLAWKQKFCNGKFNAKKSIMLQKHGQNCRHGENGRVCWVFARWVDDEGKNLKAPI